MPAYLVELPDHPGQVLFEGANRMVVFAGDTADAKSAAQGWYPVPRGADAMWNAATVTAIAAGADMADFDFYVAIGDASPVIEYRVSGAGIAIADGGVAINSGGSPTYVVDDILTVAGGTAIRAATLRVTSVNAGVIDGIELVDPGLYTVAPSLTANAVTGGGGSGATMDLTLAASESYEVLLSKMVEALNGDAQIAGAGVDFSSGGSGTRLFTISDIADALGDLTVTAAVGKYRSPIAGLLSTITDGGAAGSALTIAIPATVVVPGVTPLKAV